MRETVQNKTSQTEARTSHPLPTLPPLGGGLDRPQAEQPGGRTKHFPLPGGEGESKGEGEECVRRFRTSLLKTKRAFLTPSQPSPLQGEG